MSLYMKVLLLAFGFFIGSVTFKLMTIRPPVTTWVIHYDLTQTNPDPLMSKDTRWSEAVVEK